MELFQLQRCLLHFQPSGITGQISPGPTTRWARKNDFHRSDLGSSLDLLTARPDAYVQVFDNERARAWKLALEPGQSVGPISH